MPEQFDWKPFELPKTEKEWLESVNTTDSTYTNSGYVGIRTYGRTPLIQNHAHPGPLWSTPDYPNVNDLRFTPEAIASSIKQLREMKDVQITEIKDEPDAVRIMGKIRSGDSWHEGLILCMHKADEQEIN